MLFLSFFFSFFRAHGARGVPGKVLLKKISPASKFDDVDDVIMLNKIRAEMLMMTLKTTMMVTLKIKSGHCAETEKIARRTGKSVLSLALPWIVNIKSIMRKR